MQGRAATFGGRRGRRELIDRQLHRADAVCWLDEPLIGQRALVDQAVREAAELAAHLREVVTELRLARLPLADAAARSPALLTLTVTPITPRLCALLLASSGTFGLGSPG